MDSWIVTAFLGGSFHVLEAGTKRWLKGSTVVEIVNFCTKILPPFLHSKNDQNMIPDSACQLRSFSSSHTMKTGMWIVFWFNWILFHWFRFGKKLNNFSPGVSTILESSLHFCFYFAVVCTFWFCQIILWLTFKL